METQNQQTREVASASSAISPDEVQLINARSAAQFALTPIGQQVKQFEVQQRMGQMYAQSSIIPDTFKGNLGNCVIAIDLAMRMQASPLMLMQNLYVVHGIPSFSSKFLIATINASGRFTPLRYEFRGQEGTDSLACRVYAYESSDKEHKEPLYGDWVSIEMAKKEKWFDKSGSKWQTMPNQMLRYRAAAFWQRVYCPEISMGLLTTEEAEEQVSPEYIAEIHKNANVESLSIATEDPKPEPEEKAKDVARTNLVKPKAAVQPEQPLGEQEVPPMFRE